MLLHRLAAVAICGGLLTLAGCGNGDKPVAAPAPPAETIIDVAHAAEIAKLPPEDRALAERQKLCPVTGEPLGSMGMPYKVMLQDRAVFLCCDGCEEELRAHPDKYLAKLNKQ